MQKTEKLFLAVLVTVMAAIGLILLVSLHNGDGEREASPRPARTPVPGPYKPMIYVEDNLYSDGGRYLTSLPEGYTHIGNILNLVSDSEPLPWKNFTANYTPMDSEVYYNESSPEVIYVKTWRASREIYSPFEISKDGRK